MADAGAEKEKPAQPKKKAKPKNEAAGDGPSKKAKAAEAKAAKQQEAEEEAVAAVSLKGLLAKELQPMMYGFGDDVAPLPETVDLEIVIDYVTSLLYKAMDSAVARGKGGKGKVCPVGAEDIMFLVRKEPKKYARVRELLIKDEEIKNARKVFNEDEQDLVAK
ncbi:hypothetical protein N2152v2_004433 [Parachlorella kessleri]